MKCVTKSIKKSLLLMKSIKEQPFKKSYNVYFESTYDFRKKVYFFKPTDYVQ